MGEKFMKLFASILGLSEEEELQMYHPLHHPRHSRLTPSYTHLRAEQRGCFLIKV
jgi:hypothetical protein